MPGKLRSESRLGSDAAEESMEKLPKSSDKVRLGVPGRAGPGRERVAPGGAQAAGASRATRYGPGLRVRKGFAVRVTVRTGVAVSQA